MRKRSRQNSVDERKESIMINQFFVRSYRNVGRKVGKGNNLLTWNEFARMVGYSRRDKGKSRRNFVCVKDFRWWRELAIPAFTEESDEGLVAQSSGGTGCIYPFGD